MTHWRRPGKSRGTSATTGLRSTEGTELFCVFSSNAHPFAGPNGKPCSSFSKFAAYAVLNHDGDFSAAASELTKQGYGHRPRAEAARGKSADDSPVDPYPDPMDQAALHGLAGDLADALAGEPSAV